MLSISYRFHISNIPLEERRAPTVALVGWQLKNFLNILGQEVSAVSVGGEQEECWLDTCCSAGLWALFILNASSL